MLHHRIGARSTDQFDEPVEPDRLRGRHRGGRRLDGAEYASVDGRHPYGGAGEVGGAAGEVAGHLGVVDHEVQRGDPLLRRPGERSAERSQRPFVGVHVARGIRGRCPRDDAGPGEAGDDEGGPARVQGRTGRRPIAICRVRDAHERGKLGGPKRALTVGVHDHSPGASTGPATGQSLAAGVTLVRVP